MCSRSVGAAMSLSVCCRPALGSVAECAVLIDLSSTGAITEQKPLQGPHPGRPRRIAMLICLFKPARMLVIAVNRVAAGARTPVASLAATASGAHLCDHAHLRCQRSYGCHDSDLTRQRWRSHVAFGTSIAADTTVPRASQFTLTADAPTVCRGELCPGDGRTTIRPPTPNSTTTATLFLSAMPGATDHIVSRLAPYPTSSVAPRGALSA